MQSVLSVRLDMEKCSSSRAPQSTQTAGLPLDARRALRSCERLKHISVPVLVIPGDQDEIVPINLGRQVFEAARAPKSLYLVEGADHNNLYLIGGAPYFQRLKRFVGELVL